MWIIFYTMSLIVVILSAFMIISVDKKPEIIFWSLGLAFNLINVLNIGIKIYKLMR